MIQKSLFLDFTLGLTILAKGQEGLKYQLPPGRTKVWIPVWSAAGKKLVLGTLGGAQLDEQVC